MIELSNKDVDPDDSILPGGRSFTELIDKARGGDRIAIGRLIAQCQDYLLAIANADIEDHLRVKVAASDLVQELMLAAQQNIGNFRGSTEKEFAGWLRGILINQMRDVRRHMTRQKRELGRESPMNDTRNRFIEPAGSAYTPSTDAVAKEQAKLLEQAMTKLSEEYQTVLRMRNWHQRSFEEIGEALDRSADAARKLWARALFSLEKEMNQ